MQESTPISLKASWVHLSSSGMLKAAMCQRFSQRQMLLLCELYALAKHTSSRSQSCMHSGSACTTSTSNNAFSLQVQQQFAKLDYLKDRGMSVKTKMWRI